MDVQQGGPARAAARVTATAPVAVLIARALMAAVAVHAVTRPRAVGATGGDGREPPTAAVTLAFGGDVHFESWLRDAVLADPSGALAATAELLADADLAVVNLETAVTDRGTPAPKRYTFRAPPAGLTALSAAGVDVVSLANNHGMDFGTTGLRDTVDGVAAAGLGLIGGGMTESAAYAPHRVEVHGRRIAVLGATQVLDAFAVDDWNPGPDRPGLASAKRTRAGLQRLLTAVRRTARTSDTVVVMLHWGREGRACPLPRQQRLAARLADAGADVVVGGHAHRLGPGGYLGETVVHYGLGNLVFYASDGPGTSSGVLAVTIDPDDTPHLEWRPAALRNGVATPLAGEARAAAVDAWKALRSCTRLASTPPAG